MFSYIDFVQQGMLAWLIHLFHVVLTELMWWRLVGR